MSDGTLRGRWIDEVFSTRSVSAEVQVFLLYLAQYHMDPTGRISEPRDDLANGLRCHPRKVTAKFTAAISAGLLQQTVRGQKGRTAVYQALVSGVPQGASNRHPEPVQGADTRHPDPSAQGAKNRHPETPQGASGRHPEPPSGCQVPAPHIHTHADASDHGPDAVVVDLFNEEKTTTSLRSNKQPARKRARASADGEHPAFADWYAAYPLHKARGAAVKAFTKAVGKVDDPQTLIDAAQKYRSDERVARGYIKNPATWLNQECWLDEDDPQAAASGEYRPFTNPTDSSVYYEDL